MYTYFSKLKISVNVFFSFVEILMLNRFSIAIFRQRSSKNDYISLHIKDCYELIQMLLCSIDNKTFDVLNFARYYYRALEVLLLEEKYGFSLDI